MRKKDALRIKSQLRLINSQVLRKEMLSRAERKYLLGISSDKRIMELLHFRCSECLLWYRPDELEVDHIDEIGNIPMIVKGKGKEYGECSVKWTEYIERMFCSLENCQLLCISCHQEKTTKFNEGKRERKLRDFEGEL